MLWVFSLLYRIVTGVRNRLYDGEWLRIHRFDLPVVCVGNLTTGGTGKTPLTLWLAQTCMKRGIRPAVLSRGYGHSRGHGGAEQGDILNEEGVLLSNKLPGAWVIQGADRVLLARRVVDDGTCGVILLDDGYQHRRLHRDFNLLVIDATEPFGFGHLLPRGLLRESLRGIARASLIVITRGESLTASDRSKLEESLRMQSPHVDIAWATHTPSAVRSRGEGEASSTNCLRGQPVFLVSGIGNPQAFESTVEGLGAKIVGHERHRDHAPYSIPDVSRWRDLMKEHDGVKLLTTEKDSVKIAAVDHDFDFLSLEIAMAFEGEIPRSLTSFLETLPQRGGPRAPSKV